MWQQPGKEKNQPSHVPPLKNKPETTHPCVDHRSKPLHRNLQRRTAGFGGMKRTNQKAWLVADPARLPLLIQNRPPRRERDRMRPWKVSRLVFKQCGTGFNSIGSACTHKHTHTRSCGKQSHNRRLRGLVCVWWTCECVSVHVCAAHDQVCVGICVCVCCGSQCVRLSFRPVWFRFPPQSTWSDMWELKSCSETEQRNQLHYPQFTLQQHCQTDSWVSCNAVFSRTDVRKGANTDAANNQQQPNSPDEGGGSKNKK